MRNVKRIVALNDWLVQRFFRCQCRGLASKSILLRSGNHRQDLLLPIRVLTTSSASARPSFLGSFQNFMVQSIRSFGTEFAPTIFQEHSGRSGFSSIIRAERRMLTSSGRALCVGWNRRSGHHTIWVRTPKRNPHKMPSSCRDVNLL